MQPPDNAVRRTENSFDALRLLFALFVIFTHSFALLRLLDPLEWATALRYDFGKLGVTGFFAMSGYLVAESWLRTPNAVRFVMARALRILPAFWIALLFSVVIAAIVSDHPADFLGNSYTWRWISRNAYLVWKTFSATMPGAFVGNPIAGGANGSLWTLTYELHCYAIVLLLGMGTLLARPVIVAALVALLVTFYFKLILEDSAQFAMAYHELYLAFATGMLIASGGYGPAMALLALAGAGAAAAGIAQLPGDRWGYAPLQMAIAIGVVGLARSTCLRRFKFPSGDYSYGLYVYAFPLQQMIISILGQRASPWPVFLSTCAATLPVAVLSWHCVERRALQRVRDVRFAWPGRKKGAAAGQL